MKRLLLFLVIGAGMVGCIRSLGTPGYSVTITNDMSEAVTFYARGVGENPDSAVAQGVRLSVGGSFVDHWLDPHSGSGDYRATIWALDPDRRTAFCRPVTYADLKSDVFEIRIRPGIKECAAGAPSG